MMQEPGCFARQGPECKLQHCTHVLSLAVASLGLWGAYTCQALNLKGTQASSISLILRHNLFREYAAQNLWLPFAYLLVRSTHLQEYGTLCPLVRLSPSTLATFSTAMNTGNIQRLIWWWGLGNTLLLELTFHSMPCLRPPDHIKQKRPFQARLHHQPSLYLLSPGYYSSGLRSQLPTHQQPALDPFCRYVEVHLWILKLPLYSSPSRFLFWWRLCLRVLENRWEVVITCYWCTEQLWLHACQSSQPHS